MPTSEARCPATGQPQSMTPPIGEALKTTMQEAEPVRASLRVPGRTILQALPAAAALPTESNSSLLSSLRERPDPRSAGPTMTVEEGADLKEPVIKEQIPAAGVSAAMAGGNGSGQGAPSRDVPKAGWNELTESRSHILLEELGGLESRCAVMAGRLSDVAQEFRSGNVQPGSLGSELTALQADMEAFEKRTVELALSLSVPADAATGSSPRLGELRAVLELAAETEDHRAFALLHDRATRELEGVLALEYRNGDDSSSLDVCQTGARRLQAEIAGAQWPDSHPECLPLVERRHAYSRLLDLVRKGEELNDDDWQTAGESVAASFGKRLAVAAVRGRLRVKSGPVVAGEAAKRCPSCGADLELGARFCGDCGVELE